MAEVSRDHAVVDDRGGRVGVIVSVHDSDRTRLDRCLDALIADDRDVAVVVVDNSGRHDPLSREGVETVATTNRGFGAAVNEGARHRAVADREYVAVLNDDVVVEPGWLAPLVDALDADPSLGAAQPKLLLAGTDPLLVNSLGVEIDEYGAGSDIGYRTLDATHMRVATGTDDTAATTGGADTAAPADTAESVDTAGSATESDPHVLPIVAFTGGAVLLRRCFFDDVGGFDERLFLYYEDVDLALRGAERGWRHVCVPASRVLHDKGATTGAMLDDRLRLQERNRLVTAARFARPGTIGRALGLSIRRLRHHPRRVHARALGGGLVRMPRAMIERVRAKGTAT